MTSSELTKEQRKQIQRIAADWSGGKLTAEELYDRVKKIKDIDWPGQKDAIKIELDQAASSSSLKAQFAGYKRRISAPVVIVSVVVLLLIASTAWWAKSRAMNLEDRINHLAARVNELATAVAAQAIALPPLPPAPSVLPTPTTPPPEPTATLPPRPTPTLMPITEPEPTPLPALAISGVITTRDAEQVNLGEVELTLSSKGESEQDWTQGEPIRPDGDNGTFGFTAQVVDEPRYYRLEINAPLGAYVENIEPGAKDWKVVTDTISGLITGLESQRTLTKATFPDIQAILAAVPEIAIKPVSGEYATGNIRRRAPVMTDATLIEGGSAENPVEILGQWAGEKWRLSCCQEIVDTATNTSAKEYFWSGYNSKADPPRYVVEVLQPEQETQLPDIYLPVGFDVAAAARTFPTPPTGWDFETIDGLMILSSQDVADIQPIEWHIDSIQGWFQLQAWAPRGSQEATYQVVALVNNDEIGLKPLGDALKVASVPDSEMSTFRSVGTYRLNEEHTIIIRLQGKAAGVRAGFIRLLK